MASCGVLGAGAWGTALALVACRAGLDTTLWGRDAQQVGRIRAERANPAYLPGVALPEGLAATTDLSAAARADFVLAVVPAQALRGVASALALVARPGTPVVVCAKGIERASGLLMSEVAAECLPEHPAAILSGPSFADDVARGLPTAVTLAAHDGALAQRLSGQLANPGFRLYHTTDMRGVEIGGAAKNVLAIACGIAAGRGLGASANAALVARGFAELGRFARAYGARAETLMGLSGLGDLVLTCASAHSRNFAFGLALGRGESLAGAIGHGKLAEGAHTAPVLVEMARARGVDMPIAAAVADILSGKVGVDGAVEALLARPPKAEV
ncbi:MAG: NAD(P)-dependent glycerol-3-phosphate dehydrogenase [Rhizobiales bacterium]|nr:NAD(P)-dependent glycerol-3-phosphate dehydrogenase [Hyphomicrobiales bacterium]